MEVLIGVVLAVGTAMVVAAPLLNGGADAGWDDEASVLAAGAGPNTALAAEKEVIYTSLADLEYDRQMNKVAEEDYFALKEGLMTQAARIADLEDEAQGTAGQIALDAMAEAEVEVEALILSRKLGLEAVGEGLAFCPECGARLVGESQRFCQRCGHRLPGR